MGTLIPVGLVIIDIVAYIAHKRHWKIADFFKILQAIVSVSSSSESILVGSTMLKMKLLFSKLSSNQI